MSIAHLRDPTSLSVNPTATWTIRVLDLLLAGTALVLLAPIMMLVAITIWVDSGRPIFFSQVRVGQMGRHFRMYKFRKFHKECGPRDCPLTTKSDRRMTPLGSFLARTKLDELPQLWNILKGDMSVVGPRPESLDLAACFVGFYRRVLDHKPGIFGPNQVYFRDEASLYPEGSDPEKFYREVLFPLKARIDIAYFPYRTILSDVGWIAFGVLAVFGLRLPPTMKFNAMLAGLRNESMSPTTAAKSAYETVSKS
jgi:lipopolysaccharide/colanic/teichoic acid biosynthesis glycosyltransferase